MSSRHSLHRYRWTQRRMRERRQKLRPERMRELMRESRRDRKQKLMPSCTSPPHLARYASRSQIACSILTRVICGLLCRSVCPRIAESISAQTLQACPLLLWSGSAGIEKMTTSALFACARLLRSVYGSLALSNLRKERTSFFVCISWPAEAANRIPCAHNTS
jgi:hypothetical protein